MSFRELMEWNIYSFLLTMKRCRSSWKRRRRSREALLCSWLFCGRLYSGCLASSLNCVYIQHQPLSIEQDLKLGGGCHEVEPWLAWLIISVSSTTRLVLKLEKMCLSFITSLEILAGVNSVLRDYLELDAFNFYIRGGTSPDSLKAF